MGSVPKVSRPATVGRSRSSRRALYSLTAAFCGEMCSTQISLAASGVGVTVLGLCFTARVAETCRSLFGPGLLSTPSSSATRRPSYRIRSSTSTSTRRLLHVLLPDFEDVRDDTVAVFSDISPRGSRCMPTTTRPQCGGRHRSSSRRLLFPIPRYSVISSAAIQSDLSEVDHLQTGCRDLPSIG